jgi:hypothetical protein
MVSFKKFEREVEGRADLLIEYVRSVSSIFVESFVHHVPGIALSFVMSDLRLDMSFHCSNESLVRPCPRSDLDKSALTHPVYGSALTQLGNCECQTKL